MTVCKFFLEGRCRYGQSCRFEHTTPAQTQNVFRLNNQNNQHDRHQYFGSNQQQSQRYFGQSRTQQNFGNQQKTFGQKDVQEELTLDKLVHIVKEDAATWEKSGQWLFSCYAPLLRRGVKAGFNRNEENLPGFEDYSQEELRWEAMMSNASGNFQGYVHKIQEQAQVYKNLRKSLQNLDQSTADFIIRHERGETVSPAGVFANALGSLNQVAQSPTISNFSFKLPQSSSATPATPAASSFRFQIPSQPTQGFGQGIQSSFASPNSIQSTFGQSPFASPSQQSSLGQPSQSPFGQTQQSVFGQGFQNAFQQPQQQQSSAFQQSPQPLGLANQTIQSPFAQQQNPSSSPQAPQAAAFGTTPTTTFGLSGVMNQSYQPPRSTFPSESNKHLSVIEQSSSYDAKTMAEFEAEKFSFGKIPRIPPPKELR